MLIVWMYLNEKENLQSAEQNTIFFFVYKCPFLGYLIATDRILQHV